MWEFVRNQVDWIGFAVCLAIALVLAVVYRSRLTAYVREVRQEWTRVSTPSREEGVAHTSVVIVAVLIAAGYLFAVDWVFAQIMPVFYGWRW